MTINSRQREAVSDLRLDDDEDDDAFDEDEDFENEEDEDDDGDEEGDEDEPETWQVAGDFVARRRHALRR